MEIGLFNSRFSLSPILKFTWFTLNLCIFFLFMWPLSLTSVNLAPTPDLQLPLLFDLVSYCVAQSTLLLTFFFVMEFDCRGVVRDCHRLKHMLHARSRLRRPTKELGHCLAIDIGIQTLSCYRDEIKEIQWWVCGYFSIIVFYTKKVIFKFRLRCFN